jgi:methylglutaconyl-CoA hydratase
VVPYLQTAPKAVAAAKALTRALGPRIDPEVIEMTIDRLVEVWEDDEAPHGIAAFFDKHPPRWQR